jgi:hypothetical protein
LLLAAGFPVRIAVALHHWQVGAHHDPSPERRIAGRGWLGPAGRGFLDVRGRDMILDSFSAAQLGSVVSLFVHLDAGFEKRDQTVDQFLPATNHVQAIFLLMLIQQLGETFF